MYGITKNFKFEAAHRLFTMPSEHPCSNLHGHSYVVKVSIWVEDMKQMSNLNMVIDFGKLKVFQKQLDEFFDHSLILHEDDPLYDIIKPHVCKIMKMPNKLDVTAENMAFLFANSINEICKEFNVNSGQIQVDVAETVGNDGHYVREIGEI